MLPNGFGKLRVFMDAPGKTAGWPRLWYWFLGEKQKMKKIICLLFFLFTSSVHAAIVDNGNYTTDTATGLDWLDVTLSQGRSYDDVASQFGTSGDFEGWGFATSAQFVTLLVNATGLSTAEIANPVGYLLSNSHITHDIVTLLGDTCIESTCTDPWDIRYTYCWVKLPTDGHQGTGNGETQWIKATTLITVLSAL